MACLYLSFAAASLFSVATAQTAISLSITPQPTEGSSGYINPSFAGFGIEPSNLYSFTGGSRENVLTRNLLQNLAGYTGTPPYLRIGGNTQDYMIYQESMDDYEVRFNPDAMGQGDYPTDHMIIGPRYFEVIDRFPANTPITFGLNLAYSESDYRDQVSLMAQQAIDRLKNVDLQSFEIGNEPDLYLQNHFRSGVWGGRPYTQEWLARAQAVWSNVLEPKGYGSNFFEPGATASTIGTTFEIVQMDQQFGIADLAPGSNASYIKSWNQHDYYYYIGVSGYPLTQYHFMTLSTTNDQFQAWEDQIEQAHQTPYPYALREMGVVGPIGMYGVTDVFGASLWALNFFLYAATLNITTVQLHMTDNSNASAWQPIEMYGNEPYIRPTYYAYAAFAQLIGPTCEAQIGGFILHDQPAAYAGRSAAYSVYQSGVLASIVLINSLPSNVSETKKDELIFELALDVAFGGQDLYISYLTADGANARSGTTFNGVSYEESGDGTATVVDSTRHTIRINDNGTVRIGVRDSQAVIANIGSPIGQRDPNASACAALAAGSANYKTSTGTGTRPFGSANPSSSTGSSTTGSSASETSSSGAARLPLMILGTLATTIFSVFMLICT